MTTFNFLKKIQDEITNYNLTDIIIVSMIYDINIHIQEDILNVYSKYITYSTNSLRTFQFQNILFFTTFFDKITSLEHVKNINTFNIRFIAIANQHAHEIPTTLTVNINILEPVKFNFSKIYDEVLDVFKNYNLNTHYSQLNHQVIKENEFNVLLTLINLHLTLLANPITEEIKMDVKKGVLLLDKYHDQYEAITDIEFVTTYNRIKHYLLDYKTKYCDI